MASRRIRKLGRRLVFLNDLLVRANDAPNPATREKIAEALVEKAETLDMLGCREAARAVLDNLLAGFGAAPELPIQEKVIRALTLKARSLGRTEAALLVYDDLLVRFGAATEESLREGVANALLQKAITLEELGCDQASIAVYDDLVARFSGTSSFTLNTLVYAATSLGDIIKYGGQEKVWLKRIAEWTEFVARFGETTDLALREQVAKALSSKGDAFLELDRVDEAIECYDDLLVRFGEESEGPLRAYVNLVTLSKEFALRRMRSE